tara:strand:+ start:347 stop:640 length:294 start_codon:yes stop_codon:yes gene_type:complete
MKILNPRNSERYTINGITLYASTYLRYKVSPKYIELLKDEFDENDIVYDIVMSISSEFGTDYYIEELMKAIEVFYGRNLTYKEIESFIEAYNDYQNL